MSLTGLDLMWLIIATLILLTIPAGYLCREMGLSGQQSSRARLAKGLTDFAVAILVFWLAGYGLMFGMSNAGWLGLGGLGAGLATADAGQAIFFLFQALLAAIAVTIAVGSAGGRLRVGVHVGLAIWLAGLIYPLLGHWAWNGLGSAVRGGWLGSRGFVDLAGGTLIHSLAGWCGLALLLILGAENDNEDRPEDESAFILTTLGAIILLAGSLGWYGGALFGQNEALTQVLLNTLVASATGFTATLLALSLRKRPPLTNQLVNGALAGMVATAAGAHTFSLPIAALVGALGGLAMLAAGGGLGMLGIKERVGIVSVHLGAGAWGTAAVAIFGDLTLLGTGLSRSEQLGVQLLGIAAAGIWVFPLTYVALQFMDVFKPLAGQFAVARVPQPVGTQKVVTRSKKPLPRQPLAQSPAERAPTPTTAPPPEADSPPEKAPERSKEPAVPGLITLSADMLLVRTANEAAEMLLAYSDGQLVGASASFVLRSGWSEGNAESPAQLSLFLDEAAKRNRPVKMFAVQEGNSLKQLEVEVDRAIQDSSPTYVLTLHPPRPAPYAPSRQNGSQDQVTARS